MKILVVSGYSPDMNSSANLSHNAFIEGFIRLGYSVDIICCDFIKSGSKSVPDFNNVYFYDGLSLYEKIASRKNNDTGKSTLITQNDACNNQNSIKSRLISKAKSVVRSLYGIYNPSIVWYYRAKKFSSDIKYDYIVSMGYPHVSHKVAAYLIKKKRVFGAKWIQLWEDPWYYSLELRGKSQKVKRAEYKLLDAGEEIVYVSPITLQNQQRIFERDKSKMRWCPLAAYYTSPLIDYSGYLVNQYGYFGDYYPYIRNLLPFYNAAVEKNLNVDICGSPSDLFSSKANVHIYPRLPLERLKQHEDKANVAVCLFNLGGGQIPGKIYQLAATNKTILAILDGPDDEQRIIQEYFEEFNRFVFCQNNEESISEAVDRIENCNLGDISNNPIDAFSVEKSAKRLLGN